MFSPRSRSLCRPLACRLSSVCQTSMKCIKLTNTIKVHVVPRRVCPGKAGARSQTSSLRLIKRNVAQSIPDLSNTIEDTCKTHRQPVVSTTVCYFRAAWNADVVIDPARRLGYYSPDAPTFDDLCDNADDELFSKAVLWSNHVLHALLPPLSAASQRYNLRQRAHSLQLPEHTTQLSDCNFLIRLLYKNTY